MSVELLLGYQLEIGGVGLRAVVVLVVLSILTPLRNQLLLARFQNPGPWQNILKNKIRKNKT
ncbi:MAG: hypothetical protein ACTSSP_00125 [Candidatus Asgardarchaeia archaeon]